MPYNLNVCKWKVPVTVSLQKKPPSFLCSGEPQKSVQFTMGPTEKEIKRLILKAACKLQYATYKHSGKGGISTELYTGVGLPQQA